MNFASAVTEDMSDFLILCVVGIGGLTLCSYLLILATRGMLWLRNKAQMHRDDYDDEFDAYFSNTITDSAKQCCQAKFLATPRRG